MKSINFLISGFLTLFLTACSASDGWVKVQGNKFIDPQGEELIFRGLCFSDPVKLVREGQGWKEEIVGEHDLIYFSLRRLSFDHAVSENTEGKKFHVLVLVKGDEVLIYSKKDPTCCYHAKYMDMVVVPASMGEYGIINLGKTPCQVTKTMLK